MSLKTEDLKDIPLEEIQSTTGQTKETLPDSKSSSPKENICKEDIPNVTICSPNVSW